MKKMQIAEIEDIKCLLTFLICTPFHPASNISFYSFVSKFYPFTDIQCFCLEIYNVLWNMQSNLSTFPIMIILLTIIIFCCLHFHTSLISRPFFIFC